MNQVNSRWSKERLWAVRDYALMLLGCAIGGASYPLFLVPNGIAPGGVTGIGLVLNYIFSWPVGLTSLLMNIPLFIFGYRTMGRRFVWRTLVTTIVFSILIDLFRFAPVTTDPLLATVFGGALLGVGIGIIMRAGATTGGTDLLARVVHRKFTVVSVGMFLFAFDLAVTLLAGITMSAEHAMYSMICVLIVSTVLDKVLTGLGTDKACYIITTRHERIAKRILEELDRGVTVVQGVGAYSGHGVHVLLSVVGRMQLMALKGIVKVEDPQAFLFITDTHETLGEGFGNLIETNP